jgi:hypothetical protein
MLAKVSPYLSIPRRADGPRGAYRHLAGQAEGSFGVRVDLETCRCSGQRRGGKATVLHSQVYSAHDRQGLEDKRSDPCFCAVLTEGDSRGIFHQEAV